jgi:outer membrane protein assembly factor BamA
VQKKALIPALAGLVMLCTGLYPLTAQETVPGDAGASALETGIPADTTVYIIRNIDFDIKGRSRPFALRYHGKLYEGELLHGKAALDFYIRDRTQLLVNQRVLTNNVQISHTLGEPEPDGKIPVDLLVSVADTWNIMVLPKPMWNSNDGFNLTLKARDYNFFGTMNPLRVDFGYQLNTRKESSFNFLIDSDIPFTALGLNWNINFDNEFTYSWQEALSYANTTGLSLELPWQRTTFIFDASHKISWYEQNGDWEIEHSYGKYFEGLYNSMSFSVDWKIPTGLEISGYGGAGYGELTYTPRLSQQFNYRPGTWDSYEWENNRKSVSTSIDQTLGFGRIDWIGNFRKGLEASFENTNSYDYISNTWNNYYSFNTVAHFLVTDFFGIASRLRFRQWFGPRPSLGAGNVLRGVLNDQIQANSMLSLNLEFPFRVLAARPSEWFNRPKMRIFNFEFFLSPILDFGLVHLENSTPAQNSLSAYYTAGIEALIFPDIMRSLYLCFSVGIDLEKAAKTGRLFPDNGVEFSLDLGHFF